MDMSGAEDGDAVAEMESRHRRERKALEAQGMARKAAIKHDAKLKKALLTELEAAESALKLKQQQERSALLSSQSAPNSSQDAENSDSSLGLVNCKLRPTRAQRRRDAKAQAEKQRAAEIDAALSAPSDRRAESAALAAKLALRRCEILPIRPDGHCLYAALADQLQRLPQPRNHSAASLRRLAASWLRDHQSEFEPFVLAESDGLSYEQYCAQVAASAEWGGSIELQALAAALGVVLRIVQADCDDIVIQGREEENTVGVELVLSYHRHEYGLGEHYNSVIPTCP